MAFRIRKKKDMPGGLWSKCPSCSRTLYTKELEANMSVCPECGFHHTLGARRRIEMLADPGSFEEKFTELMPKDRLGFVDKEPYAEKLEKSQHKTGSSDACVAGLLRIQGHEVAVAVLDFAFMGGSMGEVVGEKVTRAVELARERGVPALIVSASGGARMHEGAISLMQMAKSCAALKQLQRAGGFSVSLMTNPTTGGVTASFASVCDLAIAEPGALIGFAGPRVIQNTIRQELPEGFQRSEFLMSKGQVDLIVERHELRDKLATVFTYAGSVAAQA